MFCVCSSVIILLFIIQRNAQQETYSNIKKKKKYLDLKIHKNYLFNSFDFEVKFSRLLTNIYVKPHELTPERVPRSSIRPNEKYT